MYINCILFLEHGLTHGLFLFCSRILWYCSIDQELISVRPRDLAVTERILRFVYSWTDGTVDGAWTRRKWIFSMQIRPLSVSTVSCIHIVSIRSKPSAILLLNCLRKVFVPSHSVQVVGKIGCASGILSIRLPVPRL